MTYETASFVFVPPFQGSLDFSPFSKLLPDFTQYPEQIYSVY
jgi:hypothetical protein